MMVPCLIAGWLLFGLPPKHPEIWFVSSDKSKFRSHPATSLTIIPIHSFTTCRLELTSRPKPGAPGEAGLAVHAKARALALPRSLLVGPGLPNFSCWENYKMRGRSFGFPPKRGHPQKDTPIGLTLKFKCNQKRALTEFLTRLTTRCIHYALGEATQRFESVAQPFLRCDH